MLQKFYRDLEVGNRSKNTMRNVILLLNRAQEVIEKPLEEATWDDLMTYIEFLKDNKYSDSSIELTKAKLRQFYAFCFDEKEDTRYLKLIKKLKGQIPQKSIRPQDLLTPSEVKRLINVCTMEQDRCIIASLFESGMRVGELMALTVSMVTLDEEKQEVTFNIPDIEGCKSGDRTVVCVEIYPYVVDWLKCHPNPAPNEQFIQLMYFGIADRIKKVFERAGIKKPHNPHMFRHSAITQACILGLQESVIKMRFWGNLDTTMLSTYISLSTQMQGDLYKKAKGMNGDETKVINPLVSRCQKCGKHIQAGDLCEQCKEMEQLNERNQKLTMELEKQDALIQFMMERIEEFANEKK